MNKQKTPTQARKIITAFTCSQDELDRLDKLSKGNRSAFIRSLIERAWAEQTAPTNTGAGSQQ